MHEWALAEAVVSAASKIADKEGFKEVVEVKLKIGELQQVEVEIIEFALTQLRTGKLANANFSITTDKAQFKCRNCSNIWTFKHEEVDDEVSEAIHFIPEVAHTYIRCPLCGSPDFDIVGGRGIYIESIVGVKRTV
ncbi:MAG: hydrogenase nickel incorporation protein HypA [Nitrososphaeria archaeon]